MVELAVGGAAATRRRGAAVDAGVVSVAVGSSRHDVTVERDEAGAEHLGEPPHGEQSGKAVDGRTLAHHEVTWAATAAAARRPWSMQAGMPIPS